MRKYYSILLFFLTTTVLKANERAFSKETVDRLKNDSDYQYIPPYKIFNMWDEFIQYIVDILTDFFRDTDIERSTISTIIDYTIWGIAISVLLFALYLFLKKQGVIVFKSEQKINNYDTNIYSKSENTIPLKQQLEDAIHQHQYHEVVRLYYLMAIDTLDRKHLINLKKVDHHNDIIFQLKSNLISKPFQDIGVYFQYCWYGEFEANQTICDQLEGMYQNFEQAVKQHEKA
ncbi:hypothetical protein MY04_4477 [Flammeovirga sp. MY04]|uniref:hypothetical protein n=1 Tax=Flammeovirga sp. MY04 TaxID=1191459 RepID=UPI00080609D7|nr:hypothetical protein [Flammeovirga sp. MY04]ANQ51813.1 hypothetical protein MY04_4477 [Flammeovirga sp. MY04]